MGLKKRMHNLFSPSPIPRQKRRPSDGNIRCSLVPSSCLPFYPNPSQATTEQEISEAKATLVVDDEWGIVTLEERSGGDDIKRADHLDTSVTTRARAQSVDVIPTATRLTGTWYAMETKDNNSKENLRPQRTQQPIIFYSTTMACIRKTYEESNAVRNIFLNFGVEFDERDIFLNKDYRPELKERLQGMACPVPRVFLGERYIGGFLEIDQLNDDGKLKKLLEEGGYLSRKRAATLSCELCANRRFVCCTACKGSQKLRNGEKVVECTACNEAGLMRCPNSKCAFQPSLDVKAVSGNAANRVRKGEASLEKMGPLSHPPENRKTRSRMLRMQSFYM